jgi:hypothetical protein
MVRSRTSVRNGSVSWLIPNVIVYAVIGIARVFLPIDSVFRDPLLPASAYAGQLPVRDVSLDGRVGPTSIDKLRGLPPDAHTHRMVHDQVSPDKERLSFWRMEAQEARQGPRG